MNVVIAPNRGAPYASVFVDDWGEMRELDGRDGSVIQTVSIGEWNDDGNTPAVGDATGDGVPEICFPDEDGALTLVDVDGVVQQRWVLGDGRSDMSGGCSMADLDADDVYEVITQNLDGLYVLDGRSGEILAEDDTLGTRSRDSAPAIADIDGDGSAEIVLITDKTVVALGPASGRWARGRRVWNQMPYDVTSIRDDGSLVSAPLPAWEATNTFRAQPSRDGAHPDLTIDAEIATDADDCGDETSTLTIDVRNLGSADAAAGATVRVFGSDGTGVTEIASAALTEAIPVGTHVELTVAVARDLLGTMWVVQVDGADGDDCDRVNDRAEARL